VGAQRAHRELKLGEGVEQCQDRASKLTNLTKDTHLLNLIRSRRSHGENRKKEAKTHPRKITDCKGYGTHPHKKQNKRPKEKLILWHRALTHGRGEEEGGEDGGGHAAPALHDAHHIADVEGEVVVRCPESTEISFSRERERRVHRGVEGPAASRNAARSLAGRQ
jgi:hypothetical protein